MKKLWMFAMSVLLLACSSSSDSFAGKTYQMVNALNNAEITLGFDLKDYRYFGKSAVNQYFGTYQVKGSKLTFGPAGSTMMMGPRALMEAEQSYLKALATVVSYTLDGKKLVLKTSDGQSLVFQQTTSEQANK